MSCFSAIGENSCVVNHASDGWLFVGILLRCPAEIHKGILCRPGELTELCSVRAMSLPHRFVSVGVAFHHKQSPSFFTECTRGKENFVVIFDVCMNCVFRCFWGQWKELYIWKYATRKEKLIRGPQTVWNCCCTLWLLVGGTARKRICAFTSYEKPTVELVGALVVIVQRGAAGKGERREGTE